MMKTEQAFHEEINRRRWVRPFKPFTIVTKDGKRYRATAWEKFASNGEAVHMFGKNDRLFRFWLDDIKEISGWRRNGK